MPTRLRRVARCAAVLLFALLLAGAGTGRGLDSLKLPTDLERVGAVVGGRRRAVVMFEPAGWHGGPDEEETFRKIMKLAERQVHGSVKMWAASCRVVASLCARFGVFPTRSPLFARWVSGPDGGQFDQYRGPLELTELMKFLSANPAKWRRAQKKTDRRAQRRLKQKSRRRRRRRVRRRSQKRGTRKLDSSVGVIRRSGDVHFNVDADGSETRLMQPLQNPLHASSAAAATVGGVYVYDEEWARIPDNCQGSSDVPGEVKEAHGMADAGYHSVVSHWIADTERAGLRVHIRIRHVVFGPSMSTHRLR